MTPAKREAAGIIRRHVWRGIMPPSPDRRPWSMARELHIWQRLVDAGHDPHELNAALTMLRMVRPSAYRLTFLTRGDGPGLIADALQAARIARAVLDRPVGRRDDVARPRGIGDVLLSLGLGAQAPVRYRDFCGPAVVASALGVSRARAARMLCAIDPAVDATSIYAVERIMGTRAYRWPWRPGPTLRRFVERTPRECIVSAGKRPAHFLHIAPGRVIEDNGVYVPRARVEWVIPCR